MRKIIVLCLLIFLIINNLSAEENNSIDTETVNNTQPLKININWFEYENEIKNNVQEYDLINLIKSKLENKVSELKNFKISSVPDYYVKGKLSDFKIEIYSYDNDNNIKEKRIEIVLDVEIQNNNSVTVFSEKDLFEELIYNSVTNKSEFGKSDKEAVYELIDKVNIKIIDILNDFKTSKFDKLIKKKKKKIELSPLQKSIVSGVKPKPKPKQTKKIEPKFKFKMNLENEHTEIVSGSLESSGESEKKYDKFSTTENIDFVLPVGNNNHRIEGNIKVKTKSYEEKKVELDKIKIDYKNEIFLISAGDIFPSFSKITFNNAMEGLSVNYKQKKYEFLIMVARDKEGKDHRNYSKNNFGVSYKQKYKNKSYLKFNSVYTKDSVSSISIDTSLFPVSNTLAGVEGKHYFTKNIFSQYEIVKSYYCEDIRNDSPEKSGVAIDFKLNFKSGKSLTIFEYYRVGTDFNTINGIATVDREKYNLNYKTKLGDLIFSNSGKFQQDNLNEKEDKTNYLIEYNMLSKILPFKYFDLESLKKTSFEYKFNYKNKYNRLKNSVDKSNNDIRNWINSLKISNTFNKKFKMSLYYEYEYEHDKINLENNYINNFEIDNNYKQKLFKNLIFNMKGKFRYKKNDVKIDRFFNGNTGLIYKKNKLRSLFNYYYDMNATSIENQDSEKHRLNFRLEYNQKRNKITRVYNFNIDYTINQFEDNSKDYDKFVLTTGINLIF